MKSLLLNSRLLGLIAYYSFIGFGSLFSSALAQNIPDPNFAQAIRATCPECIDGSNNLLSPAQNITILNISQTNTTDFTGIAGFTNLEEFTCNNNKMQSLPILPASLKRLNASGNQLLTSLPELPTSLVSLYCLSNKLTSLPELPAGLKSLYCATNQITSIPTLPAGLENIYCPDNRLSGLPTLPTSLTSLTCGQNPLTSLPSLPNNLAGLSCRGNSLTSLPELPSSLKSLDCSYGQLTSLPEFPDGLGLNCSYNKLMSLPKLDGLTFLNCSNNQISNLPALPDGLGTLFCFNTDITSLPTLPNSLRNLGIDRNEVTCLPNNVDGLRVYYEYPFGQPPGPMPPLCDCTPPQPPAIDPVTINSGQTATLTANGCSGTVDWYGAASGGTSLSTGATFTTPVLTASTTYYASCTANGCTSAARGSGLVTVLSIGLISSIKTGSWHDPATWNCNCLPNKEQEVEIKAAHTVTISTEDAALKNLSQNGGNLVFQNGHKLCFGCE